MKTIYLVLSCIIVLTCCTSNNSLERKHDKLTGKNRKALIVFVENYLKDRLQDSKIFIDEADGLITITNDISGYKIDHSRIVTGKIDEDEFEDAVVPVYTLRGESVMGYAHLLVINSSGAYSVKKIMNNIFRIHGIMNGHVIAEISTVDPDSPGFGCNECKEVVDLVYIDGDLVKEK